MSTLLCSLLLGSGIPAYVICGYATREVTLNDQRRVICPINPNPIQESPEPQETIKKSQKYTLRDPPDFRSKFLLELEKREENLKIAKEDQIKAIEKHKIDLLEALPIDVFHGSRIHAWVAIIRKPNIVNENSIENEDEKLSEPSVFFIEPSTGFKFELNDPGYLGIESIWNHYNYYVNRQEPITNIESMKWILTNTEHWEHLLPGEPYENHSDDSSDLDNQQLDDDFVKEKHLDMPATWVERFHIGQQNYEERFPNGVKIIHYKYAIYERFAPYRNKDGLVRRLTYYDSLNYDVACLRYEWYENREDLLKTIKIDIKEKQIDETFEKGRKDTLKCLYIKFF